MHLHRTALVVNKSLKLIFFLFQALSFLFEYIGEMGKDYIYAVVPLLEDALMERDLVHRQIASAAIGHMALGVFGFGCEDALNHLLNCVWPNVFETSPHVIQVENTIKVCIGLRDVLMSCLLVLRLGTPRRLVFSIPPSVCHI